MRSRYLDVLRGFALLGILPVNLPFFAFPLAETSQRNIDRPLADLLATQTVEALFMYKFITLFSLMFGVGIGIMRKSCEARGRSFPATMARRLCALLVFGILHVVFLWFGDILIFYALAGLALFACSGWSQRVLLRLGIALIAIPPLFLVGVDVAIGVFPELDEMLAPEVFDPSPEAVELHRAGGLGTWEEYGESLSTQPFHPELERAVYLEAGYGRQVVTRLITWVAYALTFGLYIGWRIAGLFLVGMVLARSKWFMHPEEFPRPFARMALWGLGIGGGLQGVATWIGLQGADSGLALVRIELLEYVAALGLSAGYAGVVGLVVARVAARWTYPFEALGRTAFTGYISQSVIAAGLFYWCGLYDSVSHAELFGIGVGIWVLQLVVAPIWVSTVGQGPLERVWRRLTYG